MNIEWKSKKKKKKNKKMRSLWESPFEFIGVDNEKFARHCVQSFLNRCVERFQKVSCAYQSRTMIDQSDFSTNSGMPVKAVPTIYFIRTCILLNRLPMANFLLPVEQNFRCVRNLSENQQFKYIFLKMLQ